MLAIFVAIRDEFRAAESIELGWDTLIFYGDRLVWIGLSMTLFPVLDLAYRSADLDELVVCRGPMNAVLVGLSTLLLIQFAVSFGMLLMAEVGDVVSKMPLWLLNGYGMLLIGATLCSLAYVVRLEALGLCEAGNDGTGPQRGILGDRVDGHPDWRLVPREVRS